MSGNKLVLGGPMPPRRKQQVVDLLKSLETKNPVPFAYVNANKYIQHNLQVGPGPEGVAALIQNMPPDASVNTIPGLIAGLQALAAKEQAVVYKGVHMVLGEGNFVLVVAEATFGGVPTAIYDLFRIESGMVAEHWDTLEAIPPRDQWKNSNGKF